MRFDDSLRTVLSAETQSDAGAQAAWRQLVDLVGRGRVPADDAALARLRALREAVPVAVRAASARALAFAQPPAALVALFGQDSLEIAAPVLRTAVLTGEDWLTILPHLSPAGRSVLRHRRDLPSAAVRGLEAFGATDFVLEHAKLPKAVPAEAGAVTPEIQPVSLHAGAPAAPPPRFEIADLVARIDAFNRTRERPPTVIPLAEPVRTAESFRFETDATATIRWVEGVTRGALVGLDLGRTTPQGIAQVEGGVAGACRRRAPFRDARLVVGGTSDAAGGWRMSGLPAFDPASGRFLGYRGTARRPRADETAGPLRARATSDSLRQLIHELRTPTNAITGFAELIETELFGPLAEPYRGHASAIRGQAGALIDTIDDLDTAARIDGGALELRPTIVPLHPLISRSLADLGPLASLRGATVTLLADEEDAVVIADDRALDRLIRRLLAALISASARDERLAIAIATIGEIVTLVVDKPAALDAIQGDEADGAPLLGTEFALRLAGRLATELGGALVIDASRLTLRLPAAVGHDMGQASTN